MSNDKEDELQREIDKVLGEIKTRSVCDRCWAKREIQFKPVRLGWLQRIWVGAERCYYCGKKHYSGIYAGPETKKS